MADIVLDAWNLATDVRTKMYQGDILPQGNDNPETVEMTIANLQVASETANWDETICLDAIYSVQHARLNIRCDKCDTFPRRQLEANRRYNQYLPTWEGKLLFSRKCTTHDGGSGRVATTTHLLCLHCVKIAEEFAYSVGADINCQHDPYCQRFKCEDLIAVPLPGNVMLVHAVEERIEAFCQALRANERGVGGNDVAQNVVVPRNAAAVPVLIRVIVELPREEHEADIVILEERPIRANARNAIQPVVAVNDAAEPRQRAGRAVPREEEANPRPSRDRNPNECQVCGLVLQTPYRMRDHSIRVHGGNFPNHRAGRRCPVVDGHRRCEYIYFNDRVLHSHQNGRRCPLFRNYNLTCSMCGLVTDRRSRLERHSVICAARVQQIARRLDEQRSGRRRR